MSDENIEEQKRVVPTSAELLEGDYERAATKVVAVESSDADSQSSLGTRRKFFVAESVIRLAKFRSRNR
mgnify:CR=1 FL=1